MWHCYIVVRHEKWFEKLVVDGMTAFDTATGECERTPGIDYGTRMLVVGDTLCIVTNETVAG